MSGSDNNYDIKLPSTRSVLSYMFLPEIKRSLPAFDHIKPIFIRIIALMFAHAGLIRPNHPATMYGMYKNMPKMKFSDLLGEAWFNLKTNDGVTPYHYSVFISVIMMICMTIAAFILFITNLLLGTASAQLFNHPTLATDFGSVPAIASGTLYDVGAGTPDLAISILDKVLRQAVMGNGGALQNAFGPLIQTYNTAILVIASFAIFWAIISIVVDTARTGQIGGGRHSMVWVPIRFVFSLGLLIPLASGFNSGQLIVMKMAEWGSNLGTNGWVTYVASVADASLIAPVTYEEQVDIAVGLAKVWTCAEAYNLNLVNGGGITNNYRIWHYPSGGAAPTAALPTAFPNGTNKATVKIGNRASNRLCGMYKIPNPTWDGLNPTGVASEDVFRAVGRTARQAHLNGFNAMMGAAQGIGCSLANEYNKFSNTACPSGGNAAIGGGDAIYGNGVVPGASAIDGMVNAYTAAITAGITTAQAQLQAHVTSPGFLTTLRNEGWAGMGKWYHKVSTLNNAMAELLAPGITVSEGTLKERVGYEAFVSLFRSSKEKKSKKKARETEAKFDEWWSGLSTTAAPGTPTGNALQGAIAADGSASGAGGGRGILGKIMNAMFKGKSFLTLDGSGSATYPLAALAKTGQNFITYTMGAYAGLAVIQMGAGAFSAIPFVGKLGSAVNDILQGPIGELVSSLLFTMMVAAMVLAYYIPLLPWIRVTFSVLSWIVSVFEAVVVSPLLALANLSTEGDGLFTQTGRTIWISLLNILLRPILTVIGFVGSLLIFNAMVLYVNDTFNATVTMVAAGGFLAAINWIVYTVIYVFVIYTLANSTFKLIDDMPNTVSKWIGGPRDENYQDSNAEGFIVAASGTARQAGTAAHKTANKAGEAGKSAGGWAGKRLGKAGASETPPS